MSWRLRKKCDPTVLREAFSKILAPSAVALLCSCGGGGGNTSSSNQPPSISCDLVSQKSWLRDYMQDAYFWSGAAPDPNPLGYATLQSYFDAQLFTGSPTTPRDRWSYISETDSYNQFFEEGKTLGFGVAVNGQEGRLPLKVRYVEPNSPAANAGIARGETIKSINGVSDAELFASGDFSGLAAEKVGDTLTLQLEGASGARTVALVGATYALLPVSKATLLSLANGSKAGYIVLKDFITQAETPLNVAIDELRRGGATELIVDLRYNGGGRISTATVLASLIAGSVHDGKVFTRLTYNNGQTSNNASYRFSTISKGYRRVVILTGSRTCSASELLVNGLKPYLDVVTIGGQTCGKPFGFSPVSNCAKTISAVNFESTNAQGEGRYYSGLAPFCNVPDDFVGELGDPKEVLASAATHYLNTGLCPVSPITLRAQSAQMSNAYTRSILEPGEFRGMRAD